MVSQVHTTAEILRALGEAYCSVYEERPPVHIKPETRIFQDLKANEPDSTYALQWRTETARRLGINESRLPAPEHGKDYTIKELVDMISNAEAA